MYVHIFNTRLGYIEHVVVASLNNAVYVELTLCKLAVDRISTCVVRAIVVDSLGSAVAQNQSATLKLCH